MLKAGCCLVERRKKPNALFTRSDLRDVLTWEVARQYTLCHWVFSRAESMQYEMQAKINSSASMAGAIHSAVFNVVEALVVTVLWHPFWPALSSWLCSLTRAAQVTKQL